MHANMEYLLAGLPIVTTLSSGGRDFYFDGRFVIWAGDNSGCIGDSVSALCRREMPAEFIRKEKLIKIDPELDRVSGEISIYLGIHESTMRSSFAR